jgi:hypothetical protein
MRAVIVIAGHVFVSEPLQMVLIQGDYAIRHFTAAASDPALRNPEEGLHFNANVGVGPCGVVIL